MLKLTPLVGILCVLAAGAGAENGVSFQRDVAPVLQRRCASCHNEENAKGGYRIDSFSRLQQPGDSGVAPFVSGKPAESEIHRLIVSEDSGERMPQKADALPEGEVEVITHWILEGASFDGPDPQRSLAELVRDVHLRPAPSQYGRPIPVTALAFSPDARRLAVSGYREVLIWNTIDGTLFKRVGNLPERIMSLAWEPQRNVLAVGGGTPGQWGTVVTLDVANNYRSRFLCDLPELALSITFTRDGYLLAAGCGDRTLRLFDVSSGKSARVLRLHADWVQHLALNAGGTRLATASRDRTARILDTSDWHQVASYQGHDHAVLAATFSPDDTRVFTTARGEGHQWHPEGGTKRYELADVGGEARGLVSAPFGIASGSSDGAVRLYQVDAKDPWLTLREHHDSIHALAVSPRGDLLASGSADGEVIIWSPTCWTPITRFVARP